MVRDTLNIKDLMSSVHFGNLPDTIEIISELPDIIHTELMLGSVHQYVYMLYAKTIRSRKR